MSEYNSDEPTPRMESGFLTPKGSIDWRSDRMDFEQLYARDFNCVEYNKPLSIDDYEDFESAPQF